MKKANFVFWLSISSSIINSAIGNDISATLCVIFAGWIYIENDL